MHFGLSSAESAYVEQMRTFFGTTFPERDGRPFGWGAPGHSPGGTNLSDEYLEWLEQNDFFEKTLAAGYRAADWPKEFGGQGRSALEQFYLLEELAYRHFPNGEVTVRTVARTIMRFGSDEQRTQYLPRILSGEYVFALGYTEPDAGSDLASLRTTARRSGDTYVVSGQKVYTTYAQHATHLWLAVRTGSADSRHAGISLLIAEVGTPGIEIRDLPVMGAEHTNEVFLDEAPVPVANRVGEENEGWAMLGAATAYERMQGLGDVVRLIEFLAEWVRGLPESVPATTRGVIENGLGTIVADAEVGRILATRTAVVMTEGGSPAVEAASAKVWLTELRMRLSVFALDAVASTGLRRDEDITATEVFEDSYNHAALRRFAGGTNEVLRDLVAQRGLSLPRARS